MMYNDYLETPLGTIEFKASEQGITQLIFCGPDKTDKKTSAVTDRCKQQVEEYFAGSRKIFDVPLDPKGTEFQKSIWACLSNIPFGETRSYLDLAEQINNPLAIRAVGGANGRNPISIIVPCHRVIGSDRSLTGYAGGVARKQWLLEHEGIQIPSSQQVDLFPLETVVNTRQSKTQYLQ